RGSAARRAETLVRSSVGLPRGAITVLILDELPRLANGKPDSVGLRALAEPTDTAQKPDNVVAAFAEVLDRPAVDDTATFVELGGDSLSYVEMSIRLEDALGHLPANWHLLTIAELRSTLPRRRGLATWMETGVVLR